MPSKKKPAAKKTTARKTAAPARPKSTKEKAMSRIKSLKDAVQSAIDEGAFTVQQVHERVAAMPFDQLAKIAALEGVVNKARGVHDQSVGAIYDTIRAINARVGELADVALKRLG